MTHDETRELIDPYADGELDLVFSREVERHLQSCPECRLVQENVHAVRDVLQKSLSAYRAPARLRTKVRRVLRTEERSTSGSYFRTFVAAAACLVLFWAGWQFVRTTRSPGHEVADEVVANHVRSLLAAHLVDIASSDRHTVKPWFDGKIDFAPQVSDFASDAFPLLGGRLDYFNGATAVALVYQHNKHPINLFIQPAAGRSDVGPITLTRRGYNLIHWTRTGMNYWAISDLNAAELGEFVTLHERP